MWAGDGDAVFIREYTLIRRDHLSEETLPGGGQKPVDPVSLPLKDATHLTGTIYQITSEFLNYKFNDSKNTLKSQKKLHSVEKYVIDCRLKFRGVVAHIN